MSDEGVSSANVSSVKATKNAQKKWDENAENYIANCTRFEVRIDPSVVIALRTGWEILKPSKLFDEGAMLPLMGVLEDNDHVKKLNLSSAAMHDSRFRSSGNGNSNARVLGGILKENTTLTEVNLCDTGLDDDGLGEVSDALLVNSTITSLNLSSNHFGEVGAEKLRQALEHNSTLKTLDLSRNALGFRSINAIVCSCAPKGMTLSTNGNFVFEEILNSVSHGIAFIFSVVGACVLVTAAAESNMTVYHFWACMIYSFSLMFLFLSSCLYHSFFMLPHTSRILQILDHVGIYMLIAGSYTPFLLIGLHNSTSARVLLTAEWIGAAFGSVFATCSDLNAPMSTVIELVMFLTMGLGCCFVYNELFSLPEKALYMLALGGGTYIGGIVFFVLGEVKPIFHVVWHMFVVLAATIHWFAIYFYILHLPVV